HHLRRSGCIRPGRQYDLSRARRPLRWKRRRLRLRPKNHGWGDTWSPAVRLPLGSSSAASVRDVKIDTSGSQDVILVATDFGLFRSTNGGATFSRNSSAVFLYPTSAGTFSQTVWSIVHTSRGWVASIESPFAGFSTDGLGKLVISTDHGATWAPLSALQETFPSTPTPVTVSAGRTTLGVGAPGDSAVYAFAARQ